MLPQLHAVTNDSVLSRTDFASRAAAITGVGTVAMHLRGRLTTGRRLIKLARILQGNAGFLIVNDRADLVAHVGAIGVHLPSQGLPTAEVRRLFGSSIVIGRSCHSAEEAVAAWSAGADYVFLGPVWATRSHPDQRPLGTSAITKAQPARVIAIGGVTPERVPACIRAGAYGVAAISALWDAPDPSAVVSQILVCFGNT